MMFFIVPIEACIGRLVIRAESPDAAMDLLASLDVDNPGPDVAVEYFDPEPYDMNGDDMTEADDFDQADRAAFGKVETSAIPKELSS